MRASRVIAHLSRHPKFLTIAQLPARFGASPARVQRVIGWARGGGLRVPGLDAIGTRLAVSGPSTAVEKAFPVTLSSRVRDGVSVRTASPARLPAPLRAEVSAIGGLTPQWPNR